jgi:hypothetical protein
VLFDEDRGQERTFSADAVIDSRSGAKTGTSVSSSGIAARSGRASLQGGNGCDDSFCEGNGSQAVVYEAVGSELARLALEGYNACLLAYGHTGSGKTYTMLGDDWAADRGSGQAASCSSSSNAVAALSRRGGSTPRIDS